MGVYLEKNLILYHELKFIRKIWENIHFFLLSNKEALLD